ncbi:MAG: hypothetical protein L3K18_03760 [Thermoplasmata archaeon]|nr:hypothetical protein [Thermoplasmata archaeon]MCI4356246.1 hypothetical protein [Thermoplasmata archaeon]
MPGHPTFRAPFAVVVLLLLLVSGLAGTHVASHGSGAVVPTSAGAFAPASPSADSAAIAAERLGAAQRSLADGGGPAQRAPLPEGWPARIGCWDPLTCETPRAMGNAAPSVLGGWHQLGRTDVRYGPSMCYDPVDGFVLSFGGLFDPGSTWTYANGTWTNRTSSLTASPPARELGSMTYDPALGAVVLFGGAVLVSTNFTVANDSWSFRGGAWTQIGAGLGPAPPPRYGGGFAYDANDSAAVLFGGFNRTNAAVNGTWELVAGRWSNVTGNQTSSPAASSYPLMAADAGSGGVVLFSGGVAAQSYPNQTWTFTGNRWTNLTSVAVGTPGPRIDGGITTDSTDGGAVVFGGYLPPPNGTLLPAEPRDTWRFHNGTWARLATGATAPSSRVIPAMADDPGIGGVFLFGGYDQFNQTPFNDTWTLVAGTWTPAGNASSPTPRLAPMMAYDTATDGVILFGGSGLNDTWSYAHGAWTLLHPSRSPPGRVAGVLTDDPADHELVLWGGEAIVGGPLGVVYYNDTWTWANGTWTNLTSSAGGPSGAVSASAAYDSTSQQVVLFGGAARISDFNATWSFHAGKWTNATPVGFSPSTRSGATMADDPTDLGVVLFGGVCSRSSIGGLCNDTWTWVAGAWSLHAVAHSPPIRATAGAVYSPAFGADVLFGGYGYHCISGPNFTSCNQIELADTWTYRSGVWTNVTSLVGPGPTNGAGVAFVDDRSDGYEFGFDAPGEGGGFGTGSWWALGAVSVPVPLLVSAPTATVNPVAAGSNTTLSVTISGGVVPYAIVWNGLPTGCASANATQDACRPSAAGSFDVTVTVSDAGANRVTSAVLSLNVTTGPVMLGRVTVSPTTATVDFGASAQFAASATDSTGHALTGVSFEWSLAPAALGSLNRSSGGVVSVVGGSTAGVVEVEVNGTFAGTTMSAFANLTIIAPPTNFGPPSAGLSALEEGVAVVAIVGILAIAALALVLRSRRGPPSAALEGEIVESPESEP